MYDDAMKPSNAMYMYQKGKSRVRRYQESEMVPSLPQDALHEPCNSATHSRKTHDVVLVRGVGLETGLACGLVGVIVCVRGSSGVDKGVAGDGAGTTIGTSGCDQTDTTDTSTCWGEGGQEGGTLLVGGRQHLTGSGHEVARRCSGGGTTFRIGCGANHSRAVLSLRDGVALVVHASDGHCHAGGDLAQDGCGLHDWLAVGGDSDLDGNDNGAIGSSRRRWRRVDSGISGLCWRIGIASCALLGRGIALRWRLLRALGRRHYDRRVGSLGRICAGAVSRRRLTLPKVIDCGDDELGGQGRVAVVDMLNTAVVSLKDAVLEVLQLAQCRLQRILRNGIEQILECFVCAGVDGVGLVFWRRRLSKNSAE